MLTYYNILSNQLNIKLSWFFSHLNTDVSVFHVICFPTNHCNIKPKHCIVCRYNFSCFWITPFPHSCTQIHEVPGVYCQRLKAMQRGIRIWLQQYVHKLMLQKNAYIWYQVESLFLMNILPDVLCIGIITYSSQLLVLKTFPSLTEHRWIHRMFLFSTLYCHCH